jgi:hypothetical protein
MKTVTRILRAALPALAFAAGLVACSPSTTAVTDVLDAIASIPTSGSLLPGSLADGTVAKAAGDIGTVDAGSQEGLRSDGYVRMRKEIDEISAADQTTSSA